MDRRSRSTRRPALRSPLALAMAAAGIILAAAQGVPAQPPGAAPARVAILPFAVSGALEFESVGPFVPEMLASRMSGMGSFRFVDTVEMRKAGGGSPSGNLAPEDAARLASRFDADFVIAGAIRRSGGVTVLSTQAYARDGSLVGERAVLPVSTLEDLLPKMVPLAEALASRLRPVRGTGGGGGS